MSNHFKVDLAARAGAAEVITWRCTKGHALLHVHLAPAILGPNDDPAPAWIVERFWRAPAKVNPDRLHRGMAWRSRGAAVRLPLRVADWPAEVGFTLSCRCGDRGPVDLPLLAEDVAKVSRTHGPVKRTV